MRKTQPHLHTRSRRAGTRRVVRQTLILCASMVTLLAIASACADDLPEATDIDKFRVLGIRAEEPSVAPGETTELSVLSFDPKGRTLSYKWSWCPGFGSPEQGFPCAVTQAEFASLLDGAGVDPSAFPAFDLGEEATASFVLGADAETLATLCRAATASRPTTGDLDECDRSFSVGVKVELSAGDEHLVAIHELPLLIDLAESNQNPELDGWYAERDGEQTPLADGATLRAGATYTIHGEISESSQETYLGPVTAQDPVPPELREGLTFSWFSTGGEWSETRTGTIEGAIDLEEARGNRWKAPSTGPVWLFMVVRDGRGGTSWDLAEIELE